MALRRRSGDMTGGAIWPGFVDALTAMLLVLTFVLSIFMITQYFLRVTITGQEETISEKERALDTLSGRLDSLSDMLSLEKTEKETLATEGIRLRASLVDLGEAKSAVDAQIIELAADLEATEEQLTTEQARLEREKAETEALQALTDSLRGDLAETAEALTAEEKKRAVEAAAADALRKRLADADTEMTAMELQLEERRKQAAETLTLLAAAQAAQTTLSEERDTAVKELSEREALLKVARAELATVSETTEEEQRQVALLNEQTRELRTQLKALEARLAVTESRRAQAEEIGETRATTIQDLGTRLNAALAEKNAALEGERTALEEKQAALEEKRKLLEEQVDELSGFRSEFFGRVRQALADREEIQIVGDRFVFQSEVLFGSASAELRDAGQQELGKLARILNDISKDIPSDVNWILRIDGHTDKRPLNPGRTPYRNNWELSQARALSVAEYLIEEHGVDPDRLAPTGFGEYQPLDAGDDPISLARNRRIELKLTER